MLFDGSSGQKPQTEARRYVYRVLCAMLDVETHGDPDGWMFGGVDEEPDQRRLRKAIAAVRCELARKGLPRGCAPIADEKGGDDG